MKRSERLEISRCLDEQHLWVLVSASIEDKGAYRGSARREKLCQRCSSLKIEHFNWRGEVMNRQYKSDETYIKACRELAPTIQERRVAYRMLWLKETFGTGIVKKNDAIG